MSSSKTINTEAVIKHETRKECNKIIANEINIGGQNKNFSHRLIVHEKLFAHRKEDTIASFVLKENLKERKSTKVKSVIDTVTNCEMKFRTRLCMWLCRCANRGAA